MDVYGKSSEYYDLIYQNMDYEEECDALEQIFKKFLSEKPKKILDVGCGTGSHSIILSKRDYDVTGIDISNEMIKMAEKKAEDEKVEAEFLVQDMRNLELGDRKFDSSICMFAAIDYIPTYEGLVDLLSGLKRHMVKGGLFIFEFFSLTGVKIYTSRSAWRKIPKERETLYLLAESEFDVESSILTLNHDYILVREDGAETFEETHQLKVYSLPEIRHYLEQNGFELLSAHDWEKENKVKLDKIGEDSTRVLAVFRLL